ncbi:MAG: transaldolase family protein [Candidatus Promineifilaceae bacterium]|nr:transaldolase family protein [Candidatus Promineifilaceae bacterium]
MTKLHQLHELGQSTWLNYMRRRFIQSGGLRDCLAEGIQGVTANAEVFVDTISNHTDYDRDIQREVRAGTPTARIHEALMVDDVQRAADLLHPIFEESEGLNGFASLELDTAITTEIVKTVATARHLLNRIDRGNAMVEIPASREGVNAMRELTADGISVNATHIFSISVFERVAQAYIAGLETFFDTHSVWRIAPTAVASYSISAVDHAVDKALAAINRPALIGKTGIATAHLLYARFQEIFSGPRWEQLARRGGRKLRPKWTRIFPDDSIYATTYYVDQLIGADTVVTFTPRTLNAFLEKGIVEQTIAKDLEQAQEQVHALTKSGIDLEGMMEDLQRHYLDVSEKQYRALVRSVVSKLYVEAPASS